MRTERDSIGRPLARRGTTASSITCMMRGTPAMTITFSSMKPGARESALSISAAPFGMRAMRNRAGVSSLSLKRLPHGRHGLRIDHDLDRERLGDGVGGHVVMGWADAAGGEDIGKTRAERIHGRHDLGLDVGNHPHLAQQNADAG